MVLSPSILFVVFVMGNVRAETAIHDKDICFYFAFCLLVLYLSSLS